MELERPDLTGLPPEVVDYIEAMEAELLRSGRDRPTAPQLEESEPPTSQQVITFTADGIGKRGQKNEHDDYWNSVVNKLLELLDGAVRSEGLVIVGATNHPDAIDPAIRRSGRLETHIEIPLPDVDALVGILAHHLGIDCPNVIATRPALSGDNAREPQEDKNHAAV